MTFPADLTAYLAQHGDLLGAAAMAATKPLHVPGRDAVIEVPLLRKPFEAQSHLITANIRALQHGEKSLLVSGATGVGKTLVTQGIVHGHAAGKGYRAIILCPPHLTAKWKREIEMTIPGAYAQIVDSYRDMTRMRRMDKAVGAGWWVVSNSKAKLGPKWKPAVMDRHGFAICPLCMEKQVRQDKQSGEQVDMLAEEFAESRMECCHCETPLWQWTSELDRWPVAQYVHKKLKGYFDYSIVDECFPGGTPVECGDGVKPISQVKPGDMAWSWDGDRRVLRRIVRVIKKTGVNKLVEVIHTAGRIRCTPNHKIWTERGMVPAGELRSGDRIKKTVPSVRKLDAGACEKPEEEILQRRVLCRHKGQESGEHLQDMRKGPVILLKQQENLLLKTVLRGSKETSKHEEVPDVRHSILEEASCSRVLLSGLCPPGQADRQDVRCVRRIVLLAQAEEKVLRAWVRAESQELTSCTRCNKSIGLGPGAGGGPGERKEQVVGPAVCCCGYCAPGVEGGGGDRRRHALHGEAEGQGPQEERCLVEARLEDASIHESGISEGPEACCGEDIECCSGEVVCVVDGGEEADVYDLEVEGTHLYFAGGVLVSNCHQARGDDTAIGYAMGSVVAATRYSILLSGTIIGGRASHVRSLTLRTSPRSLLAEGIGWKSETLFNERYGRLEKKMASKETRTADNKQSRGRRTTTLSKRVVPGVMPSLFRHLMARTTFLGLDEIADNLPLLNEEVIAVKMEKKLAAAYDETEEALSACVKMLLAQRNTKMLSKMLVTLIGYADHPFGWGDIGYDDEELGQWVHVVTPKEFSKDLQWAKEKALVAEALKEKAEGRKFWIYATMTGKRDVVGRLESQLTKAGLKIAVMRSTIPTNEREEWIAKMAPGVDGVISHPQLVETGIDFFDNRPRTYNIPTIMFAQCGYNLFTLRQAAGRHWRIGQDQECRTKYFFYEGTMQARAMALMGKKLSASLMIEGKFSSEGLAAMAGDEGSLEMAMARSLVEKLDDLDVGRAWGKITANPSGNAQETTQKKDGPVIQAAKPAYRVADLLAGFNSNAPESLQDASDDEGEESVAEVVREAPSVIPGVEIGSWWRVRGSQSLPVKVAEARGGLVSVCRAGTRTPLPAIPATQFLAQFSPVR